MLNAKYIRPGRLVKRYLSILLVFYLIDVFALFFNINLPVGVIYGPLIYLAYKDTVGDAVHFPYLHIFPLLLLSFTYILMSFGVLFNVGWVEELREVFFAEYYIVTPLSLLLYSLPLFALFFKQKNNIVAGIQRTIAILCMVNIVYALALFITGKLFPFYTFPGIAGISLLYYLIIGEKDIISTKVSGPDRKEILTVKSIQELTFRLKESFEVPRLYLNPTLTLDMLAEKTDMPKHQLSSFLNSYLGKSFYRLVAEYRVEYAKARLKENQYITIESLAYECGFNSKTSLNKYFREITGVAPSQYRSDIK